MKNFIIDIETGALPEDALRKMAPEFSAPKNLKDPAKIEAAIAEKMEEFVERAALSATTGRVLAIGILPDDGSGVRILANESSDDDGERSILKQFWDMTAEMREGKVVGHNINSFDAPFLIRRSWVLDVNPKTAFFRSGRYVADRVIDTMEVFAAGEWGAKVSLNTLAKLFGFPEKTGSGDQFAKWWNGGEVFRAVEYLTGDLELTLAVARKMGAI